ncbi:unnamed protein product [Prorocentrum cordatum]|uniref:Centrosomal protein of 162 kDa n=1 Tax=Prorocentrum cordatum TaxID=2364126 RepID=A0ABN9SLB5_9DINO|nr:unnamed protein product [Polarella glacialis]
MEQQLLAMHKQVGRELKEAKEKPMAADADVDMEADVAASTKARIAELDGHIEHLGKTKPTPKVVEELVAQYKQERDKLKGELFEAKPALVKLNALSKRMAQLENQQVRWQRTVDEKKAAIEKLQQEVEEGERAIEQTRAQLLAVTTERAQICNTLPSSVERPPVADAAGNGRWTITAMVEVLQGMGLEAPVQEKFLGVVEEIQQAERAEAEARPPPPAAAPAADIGPAQSRPKDEPFEEAELVDATTEEPKAHLEAVGLGQLAGGFGDDAGPRDAVKRCIQAPTWT